MNTNGIKNTSGTMNTKGFINAKVKKDLTTIVYYIKDHVLADDIYNLFLKGPDPQHGYMWNSTEWWTESDKRALQVINMKVIELRQHGSSYKSFMKLIQKTVKHIFLRRKMLQNTPIYYDDEGKFDDDPRSGIGSKFYKHK